MAEIRCQMCGESVSDELDRCPFCQARLVPLDISSPGDDEYFHPGEALDGNDTSDLEMAGYADPSTHEDESFQLNEPSSRQGSSEMGSSLPAWLRKLRGQPKHKTPDIDPLAQKGSLDDVQKIHGPAKTTENLDTTEDKLTFDPVDEELDWLSDLEQTTEPEDETSSSLPNSEGLEGKKLSSVRSNDENQPEVDSDWLDSLRGDSSDQELEPHQELEETPTEGLVVEEGIPDWMKKLQAEVDSQAADSQTGDENQVEKENEVTPDWLNRLQAETRSNAISSEGAASDSVDETPDWLDKMSVENPDTSEANSQGEFEIPDWFRNLQSETQAFAEDSPFPESGDQEKIEESQSSESESTDWMKELQENPQDSGEQGDPESELPDWLRDVDPDASDSVEEAALPASKTPDRFQAMRSELQDATKADSAADEDAESAEIQSDQTITESDFMDELMPVDGESSILTDMNTDSDFIDQEEDEFSIPDLDQQPSGSELMPDWLANIDKTDTISSGTPDQNMEESLSGIESETLPLGENPEWLGSLDTGDADSLSNEEELEIEPAADELLPAEIPTWVQAMRPVESMVADVDSSDKILEQITEKAGPLAGLSGVLPATPGLGKLRKPLNYSIKLRVSDDQSSQADQLEHMLGFETRAKSSSVPEKKLPRQILRWLVASLVFLVVAYPVFSTKQIIPLPLNYPPELTAAHEILIGLPPASPVLLVFDYEPAYSGEIEVTAAPMVDYLFFKNTHVVILSTSPTGSTLAEHFLNATQSQHNLQSGLQYTNLGYLAGGASGVLSFVENPSQTIPRAIDGSLPWQTLLLLDIHTLADFKAVIVLTDNSDTARIWVEQTGSKLGETPLLMAISAQAEPMIRPFYDSKQIKGLVTGLAGGKAYEQALQLSGLGQKYWDSFGSGLFIAELIILLGALWSIISNRKNRKSALKREA